MLTEERDDADEEELQLKDFCYCSISELCVDSGTMCAESTTLLVEDGNRMVDNMKSEIGVGVTPGSKPDSRVRISLKTREIPANAELTMKEIEKAFYTSKDEYQFIKEREMLSREHPVEKVNGLFVDDSEHFTVRGLEDKSLRKCKRVRRAEHSYRVLKVYEDSVASGEDPIFSEKVQETSSKSSQGDTKRALEVAQQDTLAAMESLVDSYNELKDMDTSIFPLLRERLETTRSVIAAEVNS